MATCNQCLHRGLCNSHGYIDADECFYYRNKADVTEVKHGTWKISFDGYYPYCPECGNEPKGRTMTEYCEKCGIKLDKPKECVK